MTKPQEDPRARRMIAEGEDVSFEKPKKDWKPEPHPEVKEEEEE